jgi:ABC-2 type transport system permease protein
VNAVHDVNAVAGAGTLARLAVRRDRIMLPAWIYVLTAAMAGTGDSFKSLYKTLASREQVAAGTAHNPAVLALTGPLFGTSVGALTAWKYGAFAAAAAGLMSIFIVIRHTRADEEAGRLELVGSTAVGRRAALAAGVLVAAGANCVLAVLMAAGLIAVGLPAGGAFALGLAIASCGLVFAAVAAVAAQLAATARGARGIAIGVLGGAFVLQSAGAAAGAAGPQWLSWLSPVGWALQVRAFAGDRWLVLALPLAAAVAVTAAAAAMAARRDLGGGLMPARPGPAQAAASLRSPLALAWRLQRGTLVGWVAGVLVAGGVTGAAAKGIGSLLGSGAQVRGALARLGGQSGVTSAYLAAVMGILGLAAAAYAVSAVLRLRSEESAQRADPVLAAAVGRSGWAASHLIVAAAGTAVVLAAAGLGAGLGYGLRADDPGTQVPRLLGAALAQLPAALVVAGVAAALFGLLPRSCVSGGWAALALAALLVELGPTFRLAQWAQDISPFTHVPKLPGGAVTAGPLVWLTLVAVVLAAAGLAGLRRRDIG